MTTSRSGNAWAGCLGPDSDERALKHLLGEPSCIYAGDGFALGVREANGGAPALLHRDGRGGASALLGDDPDAGCAATVEIKASGPSLALSCDPFGLFGASAARIGETLWFASDPRLLRALPGIGDGIDADALYGYLCFSHVPTPRTLFPDVSCLAAGSRLVAGTDGRMRIEDTACWREVESPDMDEEAAVEELRRHLQSSVCRRLGTDHEVGVFLSGGLDSSLVAALLTRAGARVHLFTLDFGPPHDGELFCARAVAAHLGRPLHVVPCGPKEVRAALDATAAALHQPFGDAVTVPLYLLGKAAAQHVDTVFNGEGGDQIFGGWANKPMIAAELYGTPGTDREAAYLATYHRFHGRTDQLYTREARAAVGDVDAALWVRPVLQAGGFGSLLHRLRAANLRLKGAQNIAPRAAQLAQAHGLRLRAPFFDRALAEWTFALPSDRLLRGACEKYLLKRAAETDLPPEIVWREKRGMGVPVTEWCARGPLQREIARRLSARRIKCAGRFDPAFVAALRRDGDVLPGEFRRRRVGEKLWTLLMLQVWQDVHGGGTR